ncbi:MAG: hypothetical protein ABI348_09485 [Nitrososphaera sp.]
MQVLLSTKCHYCDILLDGREQFMGHMIHGHDMPFEQAEAIWKSVRSYDKLADARFLQI